MTALNVLLGRIKTAAREFLRFPQVLNEYRLLLSRLRPTAPSNLGSVLVLPSDPNHLIGAKGDEAMIVSIVDFIRSSDLSVKIGLVSNYPDLPDSLSSLGIVREGPWSMPWSLECLARILQQYDKVVVIGADTLDGHYSPLSAIRYWVAINLAARMGRVALISGFSFNENPSIKLRTVLSTLSPSLRVFTRDAISQHRFDAFVGQAGRAELVADVAFLLKARKDTNPVREVSNWCREQRADGRFVLGFNTHPMLIKNASPEAIANLIDCCVKALRAAINGRHVSILFIPHDYRGVGIGDVEVLNDIKRNMADCSQYLYSVKDKCHAAELKAIAGEVDLVITGRMHLAIASLGMGTPVAAMTYQGKFQGLFQHFGLSDEFLISPAQLAGEGALSAFVIRAIDAQQQLKAQVEHKLPEVLALAQKNVAPLVPSA